MDTTNTDFYPYQYKPVLSFLESPSKALLIADEVGLGKTIEAGLIWTELRARFDARRLLVVCPKMLCSKWKKELKERFGIEGQIVNISADAVSSEERGQQQYYYLARVETTSSMTNSLGKKLPIIAGMQAQVDVITGHKTVLRYLLKPIIGVKENAFRER
jgi:SNF2 family DNA or RNA helicase